MHGLQRKRRLRFICFVVGNVHALIFSNSLILSLYTKSTEMYASANECKTIQTYIST